MIQLPGLSLEDRIKIRRTSLSEKEAELSTRTGPIYETIHTDCKGAIAPSSHWKLLSTPTPILEIDCGRFGRGPMHVRIDGSLVLTFKKPSRHQPFVLSPVIVFGSHRLAICVETRDWGDLVTCDVFVDNISITDGQPFTHMEERAKAAGVGDAEYVRTRFDPARWSTLAIWQEAWILPGQVFARFVIDHHLASNPLNALILTSYVIIVLLLCRMTYHRAKRLVYGVPWAWVKTAAYPLGLGLVQIVLGAIALGLARS